MDEIFEQMLSASSWGDGVGSMAVDSIGSLQSLSKMGPPHMMLSSGHLAGVMENQGPPHNASQDHQDALFDSHQQHLQLNKTASSVRGPSRGSPMVENNGFEGPGFQQSSQSPTLMAAPWREPFMGSMPPLPSNMGQGKPGPFPSSGEGMLNEPHLGKRTRGDEDTLTADMIHGAQPQTNGDQALFGQNTAGAATNGTPRPRVRARRGQATDPHSIAERNRRERIAERMKALQELVPDSNKTDKASMLDEIIGYVKFLQMQVKCLSMCRLGGTGAAAPLLADLPADVNGAANFIAANLAQANGPVGSSQDGIAFAERQVARLMDEDMSAAMQYLQSKGLCLMPISLATAISSTGARQQSLPAKGSDAGGNEKQAMELQAIAASGGPNDIGVNDGLAKSGGNVPKLSKEMCKDEIINDKAGHGLPSTSRKGGSKSKEDAQR